MKNKVRIGLVGLFLFICCLGVRGQHVIFVSPLGDDNQNGTMNSPLFSLSEAVKKANDGKEDVTIYLREGLYRLDEPLLISSEHWQNRQLKISTWQTESATICGAKQVSLKWEKGKDGVWKAPTSDCFDRLWVNGTQRILARYPNYTGQGLWGGTSEDALDSNRIKRWKHPEGGFIHSMHAHLWGSQHYFITGKEKDRLVYEGGYQVSRPSKLHPALRYVENILEELDAAGEWFLDKKEKMLYYCPVSGEDIQTATIEVAVTPQLIRVCGTETVPVRNISIENLKFTGTCRTFMEPYETLLRSDWSIYRGAAVFLENTENCRVSNCEFYDLGGNALFISRYAYCDTVTGNHFHHIGGSAVCLVGDTSAVRSGVYGYSSFTPIDQMDFTPGPKNNLYPRQCLVENNLMTDLGTVEKQVAGVEIQTAAQLHIRHNTIYDIPRAGINVGDGAFGGHLIEYNDVFHTVLETSDHGAFNSWGRDRFWHPNYKTMDSLTRQYPELILADAIYTTVIRNNRFSCAHGWDIDLDDGSSNYHIYNNLCLRGGIKLREGFFRKVENNVLVNNSLHPHVWFSKSGDVVRRNLFTQPYYPIMLNGWGEQIDYNFFTSSLALSKARQNNTDTHSLSGSVQFKDTASGNYAVMDEHQLFDIGFENFPMDRFGVYDPKLKALSLSPDFPEVQVIDVSDDTKVYKWIDVQVRPVRNLGDRSVFGLPDEKGIILVSVPENSIVAKAGLKKDDVLRSIEGNEITSVEELFSLTEKNRWKGKLAIDFFRNQESHKVTLHFR